MSSLFREKSLERVSSPDQMDDYVRVIMPSVWLALLAVAILVVGIIAWSAFGSVPAENGESTTVPVLPVSINND